MVRWTTEATTTRIKGFLAYMANGEVNSWWKWRCLGQLNSQWFSFNQRCWLDFAWASICCSEIPRLLLTCAPSTRKGQWEVKRLETQKKSIGAWGLCREKNLLFEKFRGHQFLSGPFYRLGLTWSSLEPQASSGNTCALTLTSFICKCSRHC